MHATCGHGETRRGVHPTTDTRGLDVVWSAVVFGLPDGCLSPPLWAAVNQGDDSMEVCRQIVGRLPITTPGPGPAPLPRMERLIEVSLRRSTAWNSSGPLRRYGEYFQTGRVAGL